MAYNFVAAGERYRQVGRALGLDLRGVSDCAAAVLAEIRRFKRAAGVTRNLNELGVKRTDLGELAGKAMNDACIVTNPRKPNQQDLEAIYAEAL